MIDQRLKTSDFGEMLLGGGHGRTQSEIDATQLPRREDSRVEVRRVTERFHFGHKSVVRNSAVETGNCADLGIRERGSNRVQIARRYANVAVADNQNVVLSLAHHAAELVHFVTGAQLFRTNQQADFATRKIANQFFNYGHGGIRIFRDAKDNFKFRVLLNAEARIVFIRFAIQPTHWFQDADGRSKIFGNRGAATEKTPGRGDGQQVVTKGAQREGKYRPTSNFMPHGQPL